MEFACCLGLACSNFGKYEHRLSAKASGAAAQVRDSPPSKYYGSAQDDFASGITPASATVLVTPGKDGTWGLLPILHFPRGSASLARSSCQMFATLRTNFLLRHNRAVRKSKLKMQSAPVGRAIRGDTECKKNEGRSTAMAIPSSFRSRTMVDGGRVASRWRP